MKTSNMATFKEWMENQVHSPNKLEEAVNGVTKGFMQHHGIPDFGFHNVQHSIVPKHHIDNFHKHLDMHGFKKHYEEGDVAVHHHPTLKTTITMAKDSHGHFNVYEH